MHHALEPTFQNYSSGTKEVTTPICDADKKILKHNTRKHALYDMAYRFCDDLFDLDPANKDRRDQTQDNAKADLTAQQPPVPGTVIAADADTPMTTQQLLQFTASILSIVLSHHHQKEDIKRIVAGTSVDFKLVRETMYKYSKKAEEKFFQNGCMAYFFIQFSQSPQGKSYIQNKLSRTARAEAQERETDQNDD